MAKTTEPSGSTTDLVPRLLAGDRRALARMITRIENDANGIEVDLREIYRHTGRAHVIGVTGPPGAGKSTLVKELAREFRSRGRTVGIIAIDPTSPFSGGAILGDRIRMQELSGDPGVFIRSMASRGALGGLARATADAVKALDANGFDPILVETVGAGQGEVDIARAAHTTIVVEVPGMGDAIQTIKAGIIEIADVFAINKVDKDGADRLALDLQAMLEMNGRQTGWTPPIVKTVAIASRGIDELADAAERHLAHLRDSGELASRRKDNVLRELVQATSDEFIGELWNQLGDREIAGLVNSILDRQIDPRSAAKLLVKRFREG